MSLASQVSALAARTAAEIKSVWATVNAHTGQIAGKEAALPGGGTNLAYLRGDKTWASFDLAAKTAADYQFVRTSSTANIASLSGPQTVEGVALVAGDICLVRYQTGGTANGPYVVNAGAWTRLPGYDTIPNLVGTKFAVTEGNMRGRTYTCAAATTDTLGTTPMAFTLSVTEIGWLFGAPQPIYGSTYYDTSRKVFMVYDGIGWASSLGMAGQNAVRPTSADFAISGQFWIDPDQTKKHNPLQVYSGADVWRTPNLTPVQTAAPATPEAGQLWYDSSDPGSGLDSAMGALLAATGIPLITTAVFTAVALGQLDYSMGVILASGAAPYIEVPAGKGGVYHVEAFLRWDNNATGRRYMKVEQYKAGDALNTGPSAAEDERAGGAYVSNNCGSDVIASAGDRFRLLCYQTSGVGLGIKNDYTPARLSIRRVG